MLGSFHKLYSSLFHLGRQHPPFTYSAIHSSPIFSLRTCLASALLFVPVSRSHFPVTSVPRIFGYSAVSNQQLWVSMVLSETLRPVTDNTQTDRHSHPTLPAKRHAKDRHSIIQDSHYQDGTRTRDILDRVRDGPYRIRSHVPGGSELSSTAQDHWPR